MSVVGEIVTMFVSSVLPVVDVLAVVGVVVKVGVCPIHRPTGKVALKYKCILFKIYERYEKYRGSTSH